MQCVCMLCVYVCAVCKHVGVYVRVRMCSILFYVCTYVCIYIFSVVLAVFN